MEAVSTQKPKKIKQTANEKGKSDLWKRINDGKYLIVLVIPAVLYFIIFRYLPMWGVLIAFKRYNIAKGFWDSEWVGFKYFIDFFNNPFAFRLIRNTFLLSFYNIIWEFPIPIIFALILNEVKNVHFKKFVQTVSYMPHFMSTVVVCSMVIMLLSPSTGPINRFFVSIGMQKIDFLAEAKWFRTIYIASSIWVNTGWGAIIYLASLSNIDPQLYEAAIIDGANKFQKLINVTLPCLAPTIVTLLLLRIGHIMGIGFEKAYLLQKPITYETSDIISTYVYRMGIENTNFSYGTAIGLFNSVINLIFLVTANIITKKVSETSLW